MQGSTDVYVRNSAPAAERTLPQRRSPAVPDGAPVRRARLHILATVALELGAAAVLLPGSAHLPDGVVAGVAAVTAALLLGARALLGAAGAGVRGLVAWGCLAALHVAVVVPAAGDPAEARVAAALAGIAALALASGLLPLIAIRGLFTGGRDDVTPGLVAAAIAGGLGSLAAVALADLVAVDDGRLGTLGPYVAAGGAVLALAEVLAHHRAGAGFAGTVALIGAAAVAIQALLMVDAGDAPLDTAVTALVLAGGSAAVGLLVATALATPRRLTVPTAEADGGPRPVGWVIAGLVVIAAAVRLVPVRPLWVDEAAVAQAVTGPLRSTVEAARHADAHPPLVEALTWAVRQVAGAGELALRAPALIAGVLLVPAVYVTAVRLYDRRAAVIAAAVAAVGPGLLWMSQGARPGIVAALLATLALFTMLRAVERGRATDWLLFGVAEAVLVWSHQLAFLHAGVLIIAAGVAVWRRRERGAPVLGGAVAGWAAATALAGASLGALLVYRGGFGPPTVLPPVEYATVGAPGAGRSVLGLAGTAVAGVVGFHPQDVTARLLALWPLGILATFALTVRRWSAQGLLLVALVALPFVALLVAQVAGSPRSPLFALDWCATAVPMVAIALGRAASLSGSWPRARLVGAGLVAVLLVAAVDQAARVRPLERVDVSPVVAELADDVGDRDLVVYGPPVLGDLVRHEVRGADVVSASSDAERIATHDGRVVVIGAFGLADDATRERTVALIEEISASRRLTSETRHGDTTVWSFA